MMVSFGLRYAVSFSLFFTSSSLNLVFSKISGSGRKLILVPVFLVLPKVGSRPFSSSTTGTPFSYLSWWIKPSLLISTSIYVDSAFTTDEPTPCRPPLVLYTELSNLPPACSVENTTRAADTPLACIPTGIPRPLSSTVHEPFFSRVTLMVSQAPARCSSTELSTISYIRWFSPLVVTLPIYIPGLFLTASSPSKIAILFSSYVCFLAILVSYFFKLRNNYIICPACYP